MIFLRNFIQSQKIHKMSVTMLLPKPIMVKNSFGCLDDEEISLHTSTSQCFRCQSKQHLFASTLTTTHPFTACINCLPITEISSFQHITHTAAANTRKLIVDCDHCPTYHVASFHSYQDENYLCRPSFGLNFQINLNF